MFNRSMRNKWNKYDKQNTSVRIQVIPYHHLLDMEFIERCEGLDMILIPLNEQITPWEMFNA